MLYAMLNRYRTTGETEAADVARLARVARCEPDPWARTLPLHFTASALVVHPPSRRILLRWHAKLGAWLQVGGHGDRGESDPLAIALREAREETGLSDLQPWPDESLRHAVVCRVPASGAEPEHEHGDLRYVLATSRPETVTPEDDHSPLRWVTLDEAHRDARGGNLAVTVQRVAALLRGQ